MCGGRWGLRFTRVATSGNEVVRWERVEGYLKELGVPTCGHGDYIPDLLPLGDESQERNGREVSDAHRRQSARRAWITLRRFISSKFQVMFGNAGGFPFIDGRSKCALTLLKVFYSEQVWKSASAKQANEVSRQ